MSGRQLHRSLAGLIAGWMLLLASSQALAQDRASRVRRPAKEPWSDGPTLLFKHRLAKVTPRNARNLYHASRLRLHALRWGQKATISTVEDMHNFLTGASGRPGAIECLRGPAGQAKTTALRQQKKLVNAALTSRDRVGALLGKHGITGEQQNLLAEMMVWRGLAYNSSTLAHGSFGPKEAGNIELQQKARDGLDNAIAASFTLGNRLHHAVKKQDGRSFLRWQDITSLQGIAIKAFPEKEPGQVRQINFTWPVNSFGVHHAELHGPGGQVAKLQKFLQPADKGAGKSKVFSTNPLGFMSRTLYWLHNIHPFRDGNGRTEVLLSWSMARAAGYPLPLEYDQGAGEFKLAATKWGGSRGDLKTFLARGALGTERFVRKVAPLLEGQKIVSNHTDHGAVGTVLAGRKGERSLMVMLPLTHARAMDPELEAEQSKNRVVLTGEQFNPSKVRIQIAINGKHNQWHTLSPAAVNTWNRRYPWWTTVEPMYKVSLPQEARFVNFRIIGQDGQQVGPADYYMNLSEYRNINSRIGSL